MVSQTEQFFQTYWQSRPAVRRNAAQAGNMTLAEKLAWQDILRRHLGISGRTQHILDVGTGVGAIPMLLARMRAKCTGLDWSGDQLDIARQRWDESKKGVRGTCQFVEGDAHQLESANGAFDAVLAINVFTQLLNPQRALNEWARVLKPGGKLVIIEDDRNSAESRLATQRLLSGQLADDPLGATYTDKLQRCPLWQADGEAIGKAMQLASYKNVQQTQVAGQLMRSGTWRWRPYSVGYMLISAENGGQIPLM
ncbi:MAG: class I SAM-dependent methyltransferase [Candidatus Promineifilaceae bacterium]